MLHGPQGQRTSVPKPIYVAWHHAGEKAHSAMYKHETNKNDTNWNSNLQINCYLLDALLPFDFLCYNCLDVHLCAESRTKPRINICEFFPTTMSKIKTFKTLDNQMPIVLSCSTVRYCRPSASFSRLKVDQLTGNLSAQPC